MLRNLAITTVFIVGAVSTAHADVYRWVDEHGSVHYSDQWVPGSEVIKSSRPRPASSTSDTGRRPADAPRSTPEKSGSDQSSDPNTEKSVKQDLAKAREQQCKEAKDRYDKAIQARRIYKAPDASKAKSADDREYLSDEEADKYRVQARKDMDDVCGIK